MKRLLFILCILLSALAFAGEYTMKIDLYVPTGLSSSDAIDYIKDIGGGDNEIVYDGTESIDAEYKLLRYSITIKGNKNSAGSFKMVLYYPNGEDSLNDIDEEYRVMVGDISKNNVSKVANRTYITYDDVQNYLDGKGLPANIEYSPGGDVSVIAAPIYNSDAPEIFVSGNVITHIFEVIDGTGGVVFPEVKSNGNEQSTGSSDTWSELSTWLNNNVAEDADGNGVPDVNEDSDTDNDRTYSANQNSNDDTYTYLRSEITIKKYVFFQPGTATTSTPPASVLEGLKIKSRTVGSNRQRTSSITVGADDYITEVKESSDPNPFKITEMEERGQN
jgi:hypothetical protein